MVGESAFSTPIFAQQLRLSHSRAVELAFAMRKGCVYIRTNVEHEACMSRRANHLWTGVDRAARGSGGGLAAQANVTQVFHGGM